MKNILLPTDYSATANNAFIYALHLANKFGVKLYVLYSYTAPVLSAVHAGQPEMLSTVYQEIEQSKHEYSQRKNKELIELAKQHNLNTDNTFFLFENDTVLGSVAKTIQDQDISLIVMGVRGNNAESQSTIGSNTASVIRNIQLPVLVVPRNASYKEIKKIAFTTLFREKDFEPLKQIVDISKMVEGHVYCVHVQNEDSNTVSTLAQSNSWSNYFKEHNVDFVILDKKGTIEETINTYISQNNIDVLAMVKRNRNFFDRLIRSSLTNKMTLHSEIPIFVFHEHKD